MNGAPQPECRRCRHYFVTYDPPLPHGCRAFQIKSRALPSKVVLETSGEPCRGFEVKGKTESPGAGGR